VCAEGLLSCRLQPEEVVSVLLGAFWNRGCGIQDFVLMRCRDKMGRTGHDGNDISYFLCYQVKLGIYT